MPSLVEIGPVVLEKKIFKISSMYFRYFLIISPRKKRRMLCAKFGWNCPRASGHEDYIWISSMYVRYLVIIFL